jgi:hypothetical protein
LLTSPKDSSQLSRAEYPSGSERVGAEQATDLVEGGGHVDLAVGVDATSDGARGFYDGHAIPSFP